MHHAAADDFVCMCVMCYDVTLTVHCWQGLSCLYRAEKLSMIQVSVICIYIQADLAILMNTHSDMHRPCTATT